MYLRVYGLFYVSSRDIMERDRHRDGRDILQTHLYNESTYFNHTCLLSLDVWNFFSFFFCFFCFSFFTFFSFFFFFFFFFFSSSSSSIFPSTSASRWFRSSFS